MKGGTKIDGPFHSGGVADDVARSRGYRHSGSGGGPRAAADARRDPLAVPGPDQPRNRYLSKSRAQEGGAGRRRGSARASRDTKGLRGLDEPFVGRGWHLVRVFLLAVGVLAFLAWCGSRA